MNLSVSDVENYLETVKCAVKAHRYRLDMNAKRPDNRKLFQTYSLTEEDAENIILDLNIMDFSDAVPNEDVVSYFSTCLCWSHNNSVASFIYFVHCYFILISSYC